MFRRLISAFLGRLRLPWLFLASAVGLLLNLVLPDPVPFLDELLMALLVGLLGSFRKPGAQDRRQRRLDDANG